MVWQAFIEGPADTLFEGATFPLTMTFAEEYPQKPPHVRFETFVFHPNIYKDGNICLDLLQNNWSPLYNVSSVLLAIQISMSTDAVRPLRMTLSNAVSSILHTTKAVCSRSTVRNPSFESENRSSNASIAT